MTKSSNKNTPRQSHESVTDAVKRSHQSVTNADEVIAAVRKDSTLSESAKHEVGAAAAAAISANARKSLERRESASSTPPPSQRTFSRQVSHASSSQRNFSRQVSNASDGSKMSLLERRLILYFLFLFGMVHFFSFFSVLPISMKITCKFDLCFDLSESVDEHRISQ